MTNIDNDFGVITLMMQEHFLSFTYHFASRQGTPIDTKRIVNISAI